MKAEIIAVGTELLLGQITNTNAQYLSQELAGLGVDLYHQTVVGDNPTRLLAAFRLAASRADLVICTGGLGPTQDDLTKDMLAHFTNDTLVVHQPSMEKLEHVFRHRKIKMVESNLRQAYILKHSDALFNDAGLAAGVAKEYNSRYFILLPGPPKEMKTMFEHYAKPWIQKKLGKSSALYSKILKFSGIGESRLEHELESLISAQKEVTIAPYAKEGEVALRLSVKAASPDEAEKLIADPVHAVKDKVGSYLFAEEDVPLEHTVVQLLTEQEKSLSAAESCTGGLLSELVTAVPGSGGAYVGGVVSYSNDVKANVLNVPVQLLEGENAPGAISAETAIAMAEGVRTLTDSDFSLSITGVAGPDRAEGKEVGLVYIGFAERGQPAEAHQCQFFGSRDMIRLRAAKHALHLLVQRLKKETNEK